MLAPLNAEDADSGRLKIVFELTNGQETALDAFVSDVEGLRKHSGSLAAITVIASSEGVALLRAGEDKLQQRLAKLADQGVDFVVCETSLEAANLTDGDLLGFARLVKTGNKEVERLEAQGWARVRDGDSYVSHL